jgi:Ca2+-binding EF-hand superfamily protein
MLTDFRKRKLMVLFDMYDIDKNGLLEQADYERIGQNLAASLHYQPGSPEYARLSASQMAVWNSIYQLCGAPASQSVTPEEYLAALDQLLSDKNNYQTIVGTWTDSLIELSDQDGDGRLSQQEYVANARSFNIDEEAATEAFRRLDRNGDGYLTHDEISQGVEEYFYSDDPQAPGNWLGGPI